MGLKGWLRCFKMRKPEKTTQATAKTKSAEGHGMSSATAAEHSDKISQRSKGAARKRTWKSVCGNLRRSSPMDVSHGSALPSGWSRTSCSP